MKGIAYEKALQKKKAEILATSSLANLQEKTYLPDQADMSEVSMRLEMNFRLTENDRTILRQVESALIRIGAEEYGICLECDEPISEKRLKAIPWAARCVTCEEKVGRESMPEPDPIRVRA